MINMTDQHQSNTATIPPPKDSANVLRPTSFRDLPSPRFVISQKLRAKYQQKHHALFSRFSAGWSIPPNPGPWLAKSLRSRWVLYHKQLRECQKRLSVNSVHQLRVATRRFMTYYDLVGCFASAQKGSKARMKLKRRLKILGELRDAQVQRLLIEQHAERFPFLILVRDFLQQRERRLLKNVAPKVQRFKSRQVEQWTSDLCQDLDAWPDDAKNRELLASDVFDAMANAFAEAVRCRQTIDPADSQTIHRTRVAFKKLRYLVEALSPAFTGLGKKQLRRLANYQRRMGNLQDLEILQVSLEAFLCKHPDSEVLLAPFARYLRLRRARSLRSCLDHADDLFEFWDPSELSRKAA